MLSIETLKLRSLVFSLWLVKMTKRHYHRLYENLAISWPVSNGNQDIDSLAIKMLWKIQRPRTKPVWKGRNHFRMSIFILLVRSFASTMYVEVSSVIVVTSFLEDACHLIWEWEQPSMYLEFQVGLPGQERIGTRTTKSFFNYVIQHLPKALIGYGIEIGRFAHGEMANNLLQLCRNKGCNEVPILFIGNYTRHQTF